METILDYLLSHQEFADFMLHKNEENTGLIVFILSDDGNYNFFPEM